jgi:alkylation response protein AidB-like acyl-CoA dehydrogenase
MDMHVPQTESIYGEDLEMFRASLRSFYRKEVEPNVKSFEANGVGYDIWRKAGAAGLLGVCVPEEYGGAGDEGLAIVIGAEELGYSPAGASAGAFLGTDICTLFLRSHGTEAQKQKYFPTILTGETVQCMGMTEPESGSDAIAIRTTAVRDGDDYVLNGSKCFISNGAKANLLYIIAKTDPAARAKGMSIILVERGTPGLTQRRMKTMGYAGGDTGEIFLDNVRVPVSNLLGPEGGALRIFQTQMALDRLQVCARSLGAAQAAFEMTLEYTRNRKIFGQRVIDFQNTQFKLAEIETDLAIGRAYMDELVRKYRKGTFNDRDGWRCKVWFPEMEFRTLDTCVQLWGGNGWMDEMPISRMFTAARVQRIYAGATELQKSLLGREYVKS